MALIHAIPDIVFQSTPSAWRETEVALDLVKEVTIFQSTPSAWRETRILDSLAVWLRISIHSLRMEGDAV